MCVICAKARGIEMPKDEYIHNMWLNNDDGAGFMYAANGKVYIEKGFMSFDTFRARLDELGKEYNLKELPLVMHFRITTHGGTIPENTHPFPVTESMGALKKLKSTAKLAVAHNGIINIKPRSKDISDTMEYIASQLAPLTRAVPKWYKDKYLMQMVANAIASKLCIMNSDGQMYTIGKFEEEDGILYSNASYSYCAKYYPSIFGMYNIDGEWDKWEDERFGDYYEDEVCWLDEGDYIVTEKGDMISNGIDNMFAIGNHGYLYEYDYEVGALTEVFGKAYSSNNMPVRFNIDKAVPELVFI